MRKIFLSENINKVKKQLSSMLRHDLTFATTTTSKTTSKA